jgi:hypothetical protein
MGGNEAGGNEAGTEARRFFVTRAGNDAGERADLANFTAAYRSGYTVEVIRWSWAESPAMPSVLTMKYFPFLLS